MKEKLIEKLYELTQVNADVLHQYINLYKLTKSQRIDYTRQNRLIPLPMIRFDLFYPCITELMLLYGDVDVWNDDIKKIECIGGKPYKYQRDNLNQTIALTNPYKIEFKMMYPNIILNLYDDGIMKFSNPTFGKLITDLIRYSEDIKNRFSTFNNNSVEEYLSDKITNGNVWNLTKVLINCAYAELGSGSSFKVTHFDVISTYAKGQFEQLIQMLPTFVEMINIDEIYINHYNTDYVKNIVHHVLDKTGLPYTIKKI